MCNILLSIQINKAIWEAIMMSLAVLFLDQIKLNTSIGKTVTKSNRKPYINRSKGQAVMEASKQIRKNNALELYECPENLCL